MSPEPGTGRAAGHSAESGWRVAVSVSAFGPCPPPVLSDFLDSLAAPFCPVWGGELTV